MSEKELMLNEYKYDNIIKDNILIYNTSIDINTIKKYLNCFDEYNNFKNNILEHPNELLYVISKIKNENDLENKLKFFDYYLIREDYIIEYLNFIDIIKLLEIHNNFNNCLHVQKYIKNKIIKYLDNMCFNNKFKLTIKYGIKYYIPIINKYIKIYNNNTINTYYVESLSKLILNKELNKDNYLLDIYLYDDFNIMKLLYYDIDKIYHDDDYIDIFKLLLKNKKFVCVYIFTNIKSKYKFDYIYEIYKNDFDCLLDVYEKFNKKKLKKKNEYLMDLIKNDILKIEILKRYIDGHFFKIELSDFINYIINDNRLSEENIKNIIVIKNPYNNLLFDLFLNIDLINKESLKSFIIYEYAIEIKNLIKNKKLIKKFYDINNINIKIIDVEKFNIYSFINQMSSSYYEYDFDYENGNVISYDHEIIEHYCIKFLYLILSNKFIINNLNIKNFLIYYFKNYQFSITDFINILTKDIIFNFKKDIEESNLEYILTTKKTKDNINIFDKEIIFKTDNVSIELGFIIEESVLFYIFKKLIKYYRFYIDLNEEINNIDCLFKLCLYAIRYNYCEFLETILKYIYTHKYIINLKSYIIDKHEYSLIDFAYTRKIINNINNYINK